MLAVPRRRVSQMSPADKWALVDPATSLRAPDGSITGKLSDGRLAAGVPVLLAPLPPSRLHDVPSVPADYEPRPDVEAALRGRLLAGASNVVALTAAGIAGTAPALRRSCTGGQVARLKADARSRGAAQVGAAAHIRRAARDGAAAQVQRAAHVGDAAPL